MEVDLRAPAFRLGGQVEMDGAREAGIDSACMQISVAPTSQACATRSPTSETESRYESASLARCANAQKRQPV